ncbi:MAG TPA: ATP-binding protein [Methylomirabilota bacterium]|jgi:signal transduction histidine kinase|nr:ATP-binding protein [Methylomirabilota bacterium]
MRLALKIFLANSLVILVLVGVAAWTLAEVARLITADRQVAVRAAEALRMEVSLRELTRRATLLEMRHLVFGDQEYAALPSHEALRIKQGLDVLGTMMASDAERARWQEALQAFGHYRAAVTRGREARAHGDVSQATKILETQAQPAAGRVVAALDGLMDLTQAGLNESQLEAAAALGQVRSDVVRLRQRTWNAVVFALVAAVVVALGASAALAVRMTRSLSRLAAATTSVAEGSFREPVPVESADEIGALARSFNSMAQRLREVDSLKEQFYATVSHELRSPLTSARESAHLLQSGGPGPLTPKQEKLVGIIHNSADRLLRLVSEVLDLSRLTAGLLPLERRSFDVTRAVRRAVKEMRVQAEERGVSVAYEAGPGSFEIVADEDRVVQVLVNLIANGIRFTPADGAVTVRLADAGAEVEIHVEDTGVGIPPSALPLVFERYRQAHSGRGGTGLGLAIVRGLVEAHAGRVSVESQEGKGTRFTVVLPRQAAGPGQAPPST